MILMSYNLDARGLLHFWEDFHIGRVGDFPAEKLS